MSSRRQNVRPQMTPQQEAFVRMEANGAGNPEVIKALWGLSREDKGYHSKECTLTRWRKHPQYAEIWKDEVRRQAFPLMTKALQRIGGQINSKEEWLANKAANDAMNFASKQIFGEDEKAVTVRIEGMPDLGSPDQEA